MLESRRCSAILSLAVILAALVFSAAEAQPLGATQELVELRTATSKTWQMADGSRTLYAFTAPIHYQDTDGTWREIDTTLVPATESGYGRSVVKNWFRSHLADNAQGRQTVQIGDVTFSFSAEAAVASQGVVAGSAITYPDAWPGVDLRYEVTQTGLKEELVLERTPSVQEFRFIVRAGGLRPSADGTGDIAFADSSGATRVVLLRPVMSDARGRQSNAVQARWNPLPDGSVAVSVRPDRQWLAGASYPVALDPTVIITPFTEGGKDGYFDCVDGQSWGTWYYTAPNIDFGHTYVNSVKYERTGCVRWNVAAEVPANAVLSNATITLFPRAGGTGGNIGMKEVLEWPWPSHYLPTLADQPFLTRAWSHTGANVFNSDEYPYIKTMVQNWVWGLTDNCGIATYETGESALCRYHSTESTKVPSSPPPGWYPPYAPRLTVTYTPDTNPPTGSITIEGGAESTNRENVTLTLSAEDPESGVRLMQFSNDGVAWSAWEAYATSKAWVIAPVEPTHTATVYVKYKDYAGNVSQAYSDDILAVIGPLSFDPPAGDYNHCLDVTIACITENPIIRYTINDDCPTLDDYNANSRTYDPAGVVVVNPYPNGKTLYAKAFKTGWVERELTQLYSWDDQGGGGPEGPGPPYPYTCWRWNEITPPPAVTGLRIADIYQPKTMRLVWNTHSGQACVKRKLENDPTAWDDVTPPLADNWDYDNFDDTTFDLGTSYKYAVMELGWEDPVPPGLPQCVPGHDPDHHPFERRTWTSTGWSEIPVSSVQVIASENQTVDSRLDTRYVEDKLVDFQFLHENGIGGVYRGGLFVGFTDDPSKISRSFLKFPFSSQMPPQGQRLWAATMNAYYTGSFPGFDPGTGDPLPFPGTAPVAVGCQAVSNDTWVDHGTDCIKWSTAPNLTPATPKESLVVGTGGVQPGNWCRYSGMFPMIVQEMYGDQTLSVGLASTNEASSGWAYFAKKEYDLALAPQVLYAYGTADLFVVEVTVNPSTIIGGYTATATARFNAPAPAGTIVYFGVSRHCVAHVPSQVTLSQEAFSVSFPVYTAVVFGGSELVDVSAAIEGSPITSSATLTVTPQP